VNYANFVHDYVALYPALVGKSVEPQAETKTNFPALWYASTHTFWTASFVFPNGLFFYSI